MSKPSYASIEKDLPTIVKAELAKKDDFQRQLFAEDFAKKRKTTYYCYAYWLTFATHRWYITGKPWMTFLQWFTIFFIVGIIWIFADLFLIPKMRRERNAEIAKDLLIEHKAINSEN